MTKNLKEEFASCTSTEEIYLKIISLGKRLSFFDQAWMIEENRVLGCQSVMYLHAEMREGKMYFHAFSEALISAGLAALLITFYDGEKPEMILKNPPSFIEEIGIPASLTPSRVNGLASLYHQMKKAAFQALLTIEKAKITTV